MKHLVRLRPSPAMVVACIALTVALGGTSYAAIKLPKNSVGTKQLKRNAVTSPKVKNDAITGADVLESSLAQVPSAATAVTAAPSGVASGSLAGTFPSPSIAANVIGSSNVLDASQATGLRKVDLAAVVTTASFNPPSIPANSCGSATATVPGAQSGDSIVLQPTAGIWGGLIWAPWLVNAPNSVEMRLCNPTPVAFDGSAVTFQVLLIR
jgi:hypothetical protein